MGQACGPLAAIVIIRVHGRLLAALVFLESGEPVLDGGTEAGGSSTAALYWGGSAVASGSATRDCLNSQSCR